MRGEKTFIFHRCHRRHKLFAWKTLRHLKHLSPDNPLTLSTFTSLELGRGRGLLQEHCFKRNMYAVSLQDIRKRLSDFSGMNSVVPLNEKKKSFTYESTEHNTDSLQAYGLPKDTPCCRRAIPARYVVVILGFFGFFNIYAMRVNLSVAMVAMINTTAKAVNESLYVECPSLLNGNSTPSNNELKGEKYNWDASTQSQMLGAFFYGYVLTQVPAGVFAEKLGAKWLFGGGVAVTAVFSLLTPLAAELGSAVFITVRVIEGLGEGVTFPAMNALLSKWSPKYERSIVTTIVYTGCQIGNVIAMPVSGLLSGSDLFGGWPSVFYFFGALGCLWFIFWAALIYESPTQHPRISKEELILILKDQDQAQQVKSPPVPWKALLTSVPLWALTIAHFGHNWGFLILLTEMPTYLSNILHFSIEANGFFSGLPYLVQAVTAWIVGIVADKIRESGRFEINTIRKTANTIGMIGPAICLLLITIAGCQPMLIMGLLCLAMAINAFIYSGFNVTPIDMAPDFSGTVMGITNGISNLCGFLGPAVVGYFTSKGQTSENWSYVFYISAGVYVLTGLIYLFFGSAELQPWGIAMLNDDTKEEKAESKPVNNNKQTSYI